MKLTTHWTEKSFEKEATGGKAAALGRLSREGIDVPDWFVVLPSAMLRSLPEGDGRCLAMVDGSAGAQEILMPLEPSAAVAEEIEVRLAALGGGLFAVRSSAADEDSEGQSHAGQLESFLDVPPAEVKARVADVWRSGFSERVFAYRKASGLDGPPSPPAVIVQRMVPSEYAGVAFSADPVTGRRDVRVVAAVRGLGDQLVDGSQAGETYKVTREGRILQAPATALLREGQVQRIASMTSDCASLFGRPQDVEWAIEGNVLYTLQSRPITSLTNFPDPSEPIQVWDNSNIAESYNGVTTPLTFSFARKAYEHVYRQFVRILGVPESRIAANADVFPRMLGLLRGRVYYNLISWYRVLAMLPGYSINREFMEQMMGVRRGLPEEAQAQLAADGKRNPILETFTVVRTLVGLLTAHASLAHRKRQFLRRVDRSLDRRIDDLAEMRIDELAAEYRLLESRLLPNWDAPLVNDFFAMIWFGVLRKLCSRWLGDTTGGMANELVVGRIEVISAEPARRIIEMASLVRPDRELARVLAEGEPWEIRQAVRQHPEFAKSIRDYLQRFGDRCLEELKLESPTLGDDPTPLYRSIAAMASISNWEEQKESPLVGAGTDKTSRIGNLSRMRRLVFRWVLGQARKRVADRENLRFERTRVFGRVRRIFVELGKRLYSHGNIEEPRDVFYLTVDEILGLADATAVGHDLRVLIDSRRNDFAAYRRGPAPPDRFSTRGFSSMEPLAEASAEPSAMPEGNERAGTPCCRGRVRGLARVVFDPKNATIRAGEILVANRTDPGWVLLFPAAAGLIVETGSLLSHSAIVSRELGLPSVVGVDGATQWLKDGDLIELDGATGRVVKLENPSENA